MKKLETDLTRIRTSRDSLQQALDLRNVKDNVDHESNVEIRSIANMRKVCCCYYCRSCESGLLYGCIDRYYIKF